MRRVIVLLLALYVLYVNVIDPLLERKDIDLSIGGFDLSFSPFSLSIERLSLSVPLKGGHYYIAGEGLYFGYGRNIELSLGEGEVVISLPEVEKKGEQKVEKAREKAKPELPPIYIPEPLKNAQIELGSLTLSLISGEEIFVEVSDFELKDRVLHGSAQAFLPGMPVVLGVGGIRFEEGGIRIDEVCAVSELFEVGLNGFVREGIPGGEFGLEGRYYGLGSTAFYVGDVEFAGAGSFEQTSIRADFRVSTENLRVMKRVFSSISLEGTLEGDIPEDLKVKGRLVGDDLDADISLLAIPEAILEVRLNRFLLDSDLVGSPVLVLGWLSGEYMLDLKTLEMWAFLSSDSLTLDALHFSSAEVGAHYGIKSGEGEVSAYLSGVGEVMAGGVITGEGVLSSFEVRDLFFARSGVSGSLSLLGSFSYRGYPELSIEGEVSGLNASGFELGDVNFSSDLKDKVFSAKGHSEGLNLKVDGVIGERLSLLVEFSKFGRNFRDYRIEIEEGEVGLYTEKERVYVSAGIPTISLKGGPVDVLLSARGDIRREKELSGVLNLFVREGKAGGLDLQGSFVVSRFKGSKITGVYYVKDALSGNYTFSIPKTRFVTSGTLFRDKHTLDFAFAGTPQKGFVNLNLKSKAGGGDINLRAHGHYRGKSFELSIERSDMAFGALRIGFGGARAEGNMDRVLIQISGISLSAFDEDVFTLLPAKGVFDVKKGTFAMKLKLSGAVVGGAELAYDREGGFRAVSSGSINLRKLSMFTYTPVGGRAEGVLGYEFSFDSRGLVLDVKSQEGMKIYSRYFSLPMMGWLELKALSSGLSAFLTLWSAKRGLSVNLGTSDFKDFYVYIVSKRAPLAFRSKNLGAFVELTSEGWVNVKKLKDVSVNVNLLLGGEIVIKRLIGGGSGHEEPEGIEEGEAKGALPVKLDIRFDTDKPIRVSLPEGYVYVKVRGSVGGRSDDPVVSVVVEFVSGELTYFGRKFYVKGGSFTFVKGEDEDRKDIDLLIANPSQELTIYVNLKGDVGDPSLFVWSEPPRSTREILARLVIGTTAEGVIPVAEGLFKAFGSLGELRTGLSRTFGVDITLSTQTGSTGDLGFNVNVRKRFGRVFAIEYQQSTLNDPRATYFGGSIRLPGGVSIYGRSFSDDTSEVMFRVLRKFDF